MSYNLEQETDYVNKEEPPVNTSKGEGFLKHSNPWHPMTNPVDLAHIGKLLEELNECGSAAARCQIQGIDESEPETGELNRAWLKKEIADVIANIELVEERFNLGRLTDRVEAKKKHLRNWHKKIS